MVGVPEKARGDFAEKVVLDLAGLRSRAEACARGEAQQMGVDGHRRLTERDVEKDVCGFSPDAGKAFKGFPRAGNLTAKAFEPGRKDPSSRG